MGERAGGVHGRAMDLRDPERPLNGELGDGADRPEMAASGRSRATAICVGAWNLAWSINFGHAYRTGLQVIVSAAK